MRQSPLVLGANILVSAFTITVIAMDRWRSVSNTNPHQTPNYGSVFGIIAAIWVVAFAVVSPLIVYQTVKKMHMPGTDILLMQVCTEDFPNTGYKHGFTVVILIVQYVMPLIALPILYAKIIFFLRRNSGFQVS